MNPHLIAYLDPGTGSVIAQALVGGIAGIVVVAKMGGRKFLSFLPFIGKRYRDTDVIPTDEHAAESDAFDEGEDANADGGDAELAALLEDATDS